MLLTRNRFITEQDTPSSYSGQTGLFTRVNAGEDALEFAAVVSGSDVSVLVTNVASQSIPNNTATIITWDTEDYDTDGMHDPAVNPSRITIQTAGKYLVWAQCDFLNTATGVRECALMLNGVAPDIFSSQGVVSVGTRADFGVLKVLDLAINDFIEVRGFQTSGGALDWVGAGIGGLAAFGAIKILG